MHEYPAQAVAPDSGMDRDSETGDLVAFIPPSKHSVAQNFGAFNKDIVEIPSWIVQDSFHGLVGKRMGLEEICIAVLFKSTKKSQ